MTLALLERGACAYLDADFIPEFDLYLSFTGGPTLHRMEQQYGARAARALFCSADPELYRPVEAPQRWDLGYLGTYSPDRQPALEQLLLEPARLAPHRRFVVAGPQYPGDIVWPANVDRIEHVPPSEHAGFYSSLGWALNITRADMIAAGYSPSVRLFEAACCATAIVSDRWDGVDEVFRAGSEILCVGSTAEVLRCLERPLSARRAFGAAARGRFLREHTAVHRAALLEGYVAEVQARRETVG